MQMSVRFEGGEQLAKTLAELSVRIQKGLMREALLGGAEPIRRAIASRAPRGDPKAPNLASSIGITPSRTSLMGAVAIGPTQDVFYARFQEFGTAHHAAQPFMRPGFEREAPRSLGLIGQLLWRGLVERGIGSARPSGGGVGL